MSESTPDRLKQFRAQAQDPSGSPWHKILVALLCIILGLLIGFALRPSIVPPRSLSADPPSAPGLTPSQLRQYALLLEQKELPEKALEAYSAYLEKASLEPSERAKVCYAAGKLASDHAQYAEALAFFYQAEMLAPASDLTGEMDKAIVFCLDKLGRTTDLRRELRKRTALQRSADDIDPGEVVLAEFAGQVLTDRDLEQELDRLPASLREQVATPEQRAQFLKNIVAERLLLDKAFRLGLAEDPGVEETLAEHRDSLIVRKLIDDEVNSKIALSDEDVERFYRAETARFTEPPTVELRFSQSPAKDGDFQEKPKTLKLAEGQAIPGISGSEPLVAAAFKCEPGSTTDPMQIGETWFRCQVLAKHPEKVHPLDEVKDRARSLLEKTKQQEGFQALIEETVSAHDVRLHLDRLAPSEDEG